MSPRTGRPKSEDPRKICVMVRFTEAENRRLMDYCKQHSVTRVEAIRRGVHLLLDPK